MKIGLFTTQFPYKYPFESSTKHNLKWGGVGEVVYQLALELNKKNYKIAVFTTSTDNIQEIQTYENITVYRFPIRHTFEKRFFSLNLLFNSLKYKVDVVHIHRGLPPATIAGYFYSKIKGVKYVVTNHGDLVAEEGFVKKSMMGFFKIIYKKILQDSHAITALSEQFVIQSSYLKAYSDKISIIPNGVSLENCQIKDKSKEECRKYLELPLERKIILFVGTLRKLKGPHILIQAMEIICKQESNVHLVLVGDGPCLETLKSICVNKNLSNNVTFAGFISDTYTKNCYYKACDIFVLPSFSEGFPMVLLEAASFGLPLVVSNLKIFEPIVENKYNGLVVKKGSYVDISNKIIYILNDIELMNTMGSNSRKKVAKYSQKKITESIESIYLSCL